MFHLKQQKSPCDGADVLTQHEHGGDDDVGGKSKDAEDLVSCLPEPGLDDLQVGLGSWRPYFQLNRQHGEKKDLNGRPCCVPESPADAVLAKRPGSDVRRVDEGTINRKILSSLFAKKDVTVDMFS